MSRPLVLLLLVLAVALTACGADEASDGGAAKPIDQPGNAVIGGVAGGEVPDLVDAPDGKPQTPAASPQANGTPAPQPNDKPAPQPTARPNPQPTARPEPTPTPFKEGGGED